MDLDSARVTGEVGLPNLPHEKRSTQSLSWMLHEGGQKLAFFGSQMVGLAVDDHLHLGLIKH